MKILGIETATQICGVGLAGDEGFLSDYRLYRGAIHAEHLPKAIEAVIKDAGISVEDLDGIAVSIGPGSFTGLRIGLGMAKGLAMGLEKPLVAVPTMDGIVFQAPGYCQWACVMVIARKREFYQGLYRWNKDSWELEKPYRVVSDEKIGDELPEGEILFLGEGDAYWREKIQKRIRGAHFLSPTLSLPSGYAVAETGRRLLLEGQIADIDTLVPLYLKKFQGIA